MNTMFGGSMSSRLFQNIREKRGLAYSVFSASTPIATPDISRSMPAVPTRLLARSSTLVVEEMKAMKQAPVLDSELRRAKDHLKGSVMLSLENTSSRMSHLARQEIYFDRQFSLDEDARRHRACHAGRCAARGRGTVLERLAGGHGARTGEWTSASTRATESELDDGRSTSREMIARYTHPDMGRIWSEERRFETWLQVEIAAAEVMADAGIIPHDAARDIRKRSKFDIARIAAIEETTQHDVIAFTTAVAEHSRPSARWLHFGLTSSDVVDTAQGIQMREATDLLIKNVEVLLDAVRARAEEHRQTPMIGRTHGVHAEPMTFGLKLALWYAELAPRPGAAEARAGRDRGGEDLGAVGTFAHLDPSIEAAICRKLGLEAAPVSSQVIQRDRHAEAADDDRDYGRVAGEIRARGSRVAEDGDR
jgi:hypothetical protein